MPPEDYWDAGEHGYAEPAKEGGQSGAEIDKRAVLEALLLVSPEPLSVADLSELTGFETGAVREILNELQLFYDERGGGLVIREVGGGFCFYSTPDAAPYVSRLISSQVNPRLTRAALETIAIVAYLQPVSRGVIAEIRGVQSEGVIKTLEDRGLVYAVGRGGPPGYPNLYGTTTRFLERFGLNSLDDLPDLEGFAPDDETVEKIKRSLSWEISEEDVSAGSGKAREDPENTGEGGDSLTPGGGEVDP
ncbi:MAG: SMC-Scp complex subunit ScpB [Actinobacteria bacterium]|nr:SMC-Scp complex subunit ScpB [Actinomycetota bacterium]